MKAGETLFEVIERAGGVTDRAFPSGAVFSRENLRLKEEEQRDRRLPNSSLISPMQRFPPQIVRKSPNPMAANAMLKFACVIHNLKAVWSSTYKNIR